MIKERLDEGQGETIYEIGTGGKIQVLSYPYDFFPDISSTSNIIQLMYLVKCTYGHIFTFQY